MGQIAQHLMQRFSPDAIGPYLSGVVPEIINALLTFLVCFIVWKVASKAFRIENIDMPYQTIKLPPLKFVQPAIV